MEKISPNSSYPIVLNLTGRLVVIVGAGSVGKRKLQSVLNTGAKIRVIDPIVPDALSNPAVEYLQRPYQKEDLLEAFLVFICTNDPTINQSIADEAAKLSILSCRSDQPQSTDFTLPAVLRRGDLTVSISTGGGSPAMAALLRNEIAEKVTDSWGIAVEIVAAIRRKWLTEDTQVQYNQEILYNLLNQELIPLITHKKTEEIDQMLLSQFGPGYSLAALQVEIN